ncbi:MAG: 1,4-dihydroxy-2-naphthoate polyprenyltransferase [Calditrichales bacterium]|nr:MAG: 1,4-dihydroxy-2-naphthoate polyprenyltransferase [Calditrichales bacterium]
MNIWIEAARPKTLWASIAPVLIGTAMAYSDQAWDPLIAFITLVSAMLIQIGTNYANDYFDFKKGADTRERIGPVRATGAGLVKPETMRAAFILTFFLALLFGLVLILHGGWPILVIGTLSLLFGILYTGGPFPLGYKGLGDIFVLIFFGPVAVGGTYYLQAMEINLTVILAGLSPGLISTALLSVNNLRDLYTDEKAGKLTLAVRFGEIFVRAEYLISIFIACMMPLILLVLDPTHPYSTMAIFVFLFAAPTLKQVLFDEISPNLNVALASTGKILLIYSLVFSLGWIV